MPNNNDNEILEPMPKITGEKSENKADVTKADASSEEKQIERQMKSRSGKGKSTATKAMKPVKIEAEVAAEEAENTEAAAEAIESRAAEEHSEAARPKRVVNVENLEPAQPEKREEPKVGEKQEQPRVEAPSRAENERPAAHPQVRGERPAQHRMSEDTMRVRAEAVRPAEGTQRGAAAHGYGYIDRTNGAKQRGDRPIQRLERRPEHVRPNGNGNGNGNGRENVPDKVKSESIVEDITKQAKLEKKEEKKQEKQDERRLRKLGKLGDRAFQNVKRYVPDLNKGLTAEDVRERYDCGYINNNANKATKTYKAIILKNVFTFFNCIWFIVAALLISVNMIKDCFFLVIITVNMVVGIVQEIKAKQSVEKLSLMNAPTSEVLREGVAVTIPINKMVADDICLLETGRQISSDGIVLNGSITVNESMLTGESDAVKKMPGDKVFAGSYVTSGACKMHVKWVGRENYISQLATRAKKLRGNSSPILKTLNSIIKTVGFLIIPVVGLVFYRNYALHGDVILAIGNTAGALIGMIPAGMFLLTSVALAVGIIKLAKNKTMVKDLYSIEMLARCNVLCLDKTGTITDGTMNVAVCEKVTDREIDIKPIISSMLAATKDNNSTAQALIKHFTGERVFAAKTVIPFSSESKYSAVTFERRGTYAIGAGEFVLPNMEEELLTKIIDYSAMGYRVLVLAKSLRNIEGDKIPSDMEPMAIIAIEDHIRDEAIATIDWFKRNNVKIKIISGDNPVTVSNIARRVGVENADKYISLEKLSTDEVINAAKEYTVFGRVTPEQKALLVSSMKANGDTVAMTGDGVNDILAFKEAHCSVAMASGSEATRNIASLVLMDSNFASMPKVVAEGRRVVNNIQSSSSMYLMKTLFVIALTIITLGAYPFTPKHLMVLELFVIGFPTFFLALQPNDRVISGSFMLTIMQKAIPAALVMILSVVAMDISKQYFEISDMALLTMKVICVTYSGLVMLAIVCFPYNAYRAVLVSVMALFAIIVMIFMPQFFELHELDLWQLLYCMVIVLASLPVGIIVTTIANSVKLKGIGEQWSIKHNHIKD